MYSWLHPILAILEPLLTFFYTIAKDWGLAVILLTLFIRILLFWVNLRMTRQQVKQAKLAPIVKEIRERHATDAKLLAEATMRLYRENGVKPMLTIAVALLQMPIFMGMYGLFTLHGSTMTSFLIPWASSLSQSDSLHIIPWLAAGLSFLSNLLPIAPELAIGSSTRQRLGLSAVMTVIYLLVILRSPVALGLYWATNAIYVVLERSFYRTKLGKRMILQGEVA